jgi:hypothetical protein
MFAFVFRRMMDFDHMIPVAVTMAEAGHEVRLGVMGDDLDIADDPRLKLFPKKMSVWRLRPPFSAIKCAVFMRGVTRLVMDWAKLGQAQTGLLIKVARRKGIPTVALPHGVDHTRNLEYYESKLSADTFAHFDHIAVPNRIRHRFLAACGVPEAKLHVLGTPRFTPAWLSRLAQVYQVLERRDDGRLKVVFFDQTIPELFDQTVAMLEKLAALPFVELAIQPKPIPNDRQVVLVGRFAANVDRRHASSLCAWADVVIGTSSTVVFEALIRGKHLVWVRHLDVHDLCYNSLGGAWIADSDDDTVALLDRLRTHPATPPADCAEFCDEIIRGGLRDDDVLGVYRLLLETASSTRTAL